MAVNRQCTIEVFFPIFGVQSLENIFSPLNLKATELSKQKEEFKKSESSAALNSN